MKKILKKINMRKNVVVSGDMFSGKTANVLFPLFDKIIDNDENVIVYDTKIEYLDNYYDKLIDKGYQVNIINLRDINHTEGWNPLELPYHYYKNGMENIAEEMLDNLGNILYPESEETDSYWTKSSSNLFTGLCLSLFEYGDESVINLNSVNSFILEGKNTKKYIDEYFKTKDKNTSSYINVSQVLSAPSDTRENILSVAKITLAKLVGNEQISNMLSKSTFNLDDLKEKKIAIFVIGKPESKNTNVISEMFFNQLMKYLTETRPNNKCHIILDNIDEIKNLLYIDQYLKLNNYSNSRYYIGTYSVENLESKFKIKTKEISDIIKIKRDEIKLESFGTVTKINNDFKEVKFDKSNIQYPAIKKNKIKVFDLKEYVEAKHQERMENLVNSIRLGQTDKEKTNDNKTNLTEILNDIDTKIAELEKLEKEDKKEEK